MPVEVVLRHYVVASVCYVVTGSLLQPVGTSLRREIIWSIALAVVSWGNRWVVLSLLRVVNGSQHRLFGTSESRSFIPSGHPMAEAPLGRAVRG
jgi:hypothetical protein